MTIPPYEFKVLEIDLCEMQGRFFELAARSGYQMRRFVPAFMQSEVARRLDSPYSRYQWMGEEYMLHQVARECALVPDCIPAEDEAYFWMGYLYRFWHFATGENSAEIYAAADFSRMLRVYEGYHTLSLEQAIGRLKQAG